MSKSKSQTNDLAKIKGKALEKALKKLGAKWGLEKKKRLARDYTFKNFKEALAFVNKVGAIAEKQGHHPDITFTWGEVNLRIWTHAVRGLTHDDFELATAINKLK